MTIVCASELPSTVLLQNYAGPAGYSDCYVTEVAGVVSQAAFVRAFYTTPLFRVERALLKWFASQLSTDEDIDGLASGSSNRFAAWRVGGPVRKPDSAGRLCGTYSVMAHGPRQPGPAGAKYLAVFELGRSSQVEQTHGEKSMGTGFDALLDFHKLYSRSLLRQARGRVLNRA